MHQNDSETSAPQLTLNSESLKWLLSLRWWSFIGQVVGVGYEAFSTGRNSSSSWALISLLVLSNLWLSKSLKNGAVARQLNVTQVNITVVLLADLLLLTILLSLNGGASNPFSILFLIYITLAAIILGRTATWILVAASCLCFGVLFLVPTEHSGHSGHHAGFELHLYGMWAAFVFSAALIASFLMKVIFQLNAKNKALSELAFLKLRQQQLGALASLSAGAAHELSTPLGTIMLAADEISRELNELENHRRVAKDANLIVEQVKRCRGIIERMAASGGQLQGELPQEIPVALLVSRLLENLGPKKQGLLEVNFDPKAVPVLVPVVATVLSLEALVNNALDASASKQKVVLEIFDNSNETVFEVRDFGSGIAPEHLERLCEPFFSLKEPGKGMGLGLFLVSLFAESVGGRVELKSELGKGFVARIRIPKEKQLKIA